MTAAWEEIESAIRQLCDARAYDGAVTRAIGAYGLEIGRFIAGRVANQADAQDIFAIFCQDLWSGLPNFAWRCTLRGWAYTLARHAEVRYRAALPNVRRQMVTLSGTDLSARARTTTAPYARTDVKVRFRAIRDRLDEEDQLILVLRVDRDLGWRDIAHVLTGPAALPAGVARREEARIRKRFQIIKEKIRRWAADDGLLPVSRR